MKSKKQIAKERINELFKKAKEIFHENPNLSDRYVEIARKIAMKAQVSIPSNLKKKFCKKCNIYLVPGKNLRIRTRNKKLIYYCLKCKNIMRYPYKS
ncbi:ribonuclease P [Candidatus Woesearchaeota archaeon]|nr:ribonuclease P [Candidatus Woesearchaeota archaeon]